MAVVTVLFVVFAALAKASAKNKAAAAAAADEPVVYYITGEFFQEALNLPEGVTVEDIKEPLRKLSIFLRKLS